MFDRTSIDDLLHQYSEIISSYTILKDSFIDDRYTFEIKIEFKDKSKLENREVFLFIDDVVKRRYKFHWMNSDNSLILRWDNAPHHPHIGNFPYHLHREREDAIEESSEMTLSSVLTFIKKIIQN